MADITTPWIDRYRASVSWGDRIHAATLPSGAPCCWVDMQGPRHYWVAGQLEDLPGAIALAQQALAAPDCGRSTVVFLDAKATDFQVEEASHVLAGHGIGCRFLEPQPDVLHLALLARASEGTLLEKFTPAEFHPLDAQVVITELDKALGKILAKHGLKPMPVETDEVKDNWAVVYGSMEELVVYACRVFRSKAGLPVEVINTLDDLTERAGL